MSSSLSLSLPDIPLTWNMYECDQPYDHRGLLHCNGGGSDRYRLGRLGKLLSVISKQPLSPMEVLVSMEKSSAGNRAYGIGLIDNFHTAAVNQYPIFGHEMIKGSCKAYFDLDLPVSTEHITDYGRERLIRRAINHLSQKCGFDSDWDEWIILACPYEGHPQKANKFSAHLIYQEYKFADPIILKKWLDSKIDWQYCATEFGFDPQVYSNNQNFRLPGGSRFVALTDHRVILPHPPRHYPLLFFHPRKHISEVSYAEYNRALVTTVSNCRREIHVEGQTQELSRIAQDHPRHGETEPGRVILAIQEGTLNCDADFFQVRDSPDHDPLRINPYVRMFHLKGYDGFRDCRHSSEDVLVHYFPSAGAFQIFCEECPAPIWGGVDQRSMRYLREMEMIRFLRDLDLDRCDFLFPGSDRSCGHFALTEEDLWHKIRETRRQEIRSNHFVGPDYIMEWIASDDPIPVHTINGMEEPIMIPFLQGGRTVYDPDVVKFLCDIFPIESDDFTLIISYINCFACCVADGCYFLRTIGEVKEGHLKSFMRPTTIPKWTQPKPTKKNPLPDWIQGKQQLFEVWNNHAKRLTFTTSYHGPLTFGVNSQLNLLSPVAYDLVECLRIYDGLDMPTQMMLLEAYRKLINMYVYLEEDATVQDEMRHTFHRFHNAALFGFDKPKGLAIALVSVDGGQGKSWGGEMIGELIGTDYYKGFSGNDWNADKFNKVNGLNVLNEIEFRNEKEANLLKGLITAQDFHDRVMFKMPVAIKNLSSYWISTNTKGIAGLAIPGMDRRAMVVELKPTAFYDENQVLKYSCLFCDDECAHNILNHADLMALLRDNIFKSATAKAGFVGMLYRYFEDQRVEHSETWAQPLGTFCPQTKAGEVLRIANQSSTQRFIMKCIERGSHFSPRNQPPVTSSFKTVYLTKGQTQRLSEESVNMDQAPGWETKVAVPTLYAAYRWFCQNSGIHAARLSDFKSEFNVFVSKNIQHEPLQLDVMDTFQHEWSKDMGGSLKWSIVNNPVVKQEVWVIGGGWGPRMESFQAGRTKKKQRVNKLRSGSFNALFTNRPTLASPPPVIPAYARVYGSGSLLEVDSQPEDHLGVLAMCMEDAQDGFDPGYARTSVVELDDIEDESEQDRRAALHDNRPRKRNKFIDDEVEEVDSSSDLLGSLSL